MNSISHGAAGKMTIEGYMGLGIGMTMSLLTLAHAREGYSNQSVCVCVCVCVCSHFFSRTVAAMETKRGYVCK